MKALRPLRVEAYCPVETCRQQATEWLHPLMWHWFAKLELEPSRPVWKVKCHAPGCGAPFWITLDEIHRARPEGARAAA